MFIIENMIYCIFRIIEFSIDIVELIIEFIKSVLKIIIGLMISPIIIYLVVTKRINPFAVIVQPIRRM